MRQVVYPAGGMSRPRVIMESFEKLGEFRTGYVARVGLVNCGVSGGVRALQARDVAEDGRIAWQTLRCVKGIRHPGRYRIRDGDLLVPLRATRIKAVVLHDVPKEVVAVGHWGILTPDPARACAGYLAWYLNHPATWSRLQAAMSGTNLTFLSVSALRAFEIEVVPLELQLRIARADELHARVAELDAQLIDARRRLFDHLTMAALHTGDGPTTENT